MPAGDAAANIGANFSQYSGDAALGGGSLGFFKLDTRPLEDLARYTFLYNKSEYDQRQKDWDKAADEITEFMTLDMTQSIPEDFKYLQGKFDELKNYLVSHPEALNYRDRKAWTEWQSKRGDLLTDIEFGKKNSLANIARLKEISDETTEEGKKILKDKLQAEINAREHGIRTLIAPEQKRDLSFALPGKNGGLKVDVTKKGSNEFIHRGKDIFDIQEAKRAGAGFTLEVAGFDPNTTTGQLKKAHLAENGWVKAAAIFNSAIQSAKGPDGKVDESKLGSLSLTSLIRQYDTYKREMKTAIVNGQLWDQLGKNIQFDDGPFRPEYYDPINWQDGISESELGELMQFAAWPGDTFETKVIPTNEDIEYKRLAAEWERIGVTKEQLRKSKTEDLISADATIREVIDAIKLGRHGVQKKNGVITKNLIEIADPNLLREFGTIDKDGTVSNVPNTTMFDKKANQFVITYYKKDGEGNVVNDSKGDPVVDREVPMNPTQYFGQIIRRKNPNKDIGGVNALVEQVYSAFNRDIMKLAEGYGGAGATGTQQKTTTEESTKLTPAQIEFKRKYGIKD